MPISQLDPNHEPGRAPQREPGASAGLGGADAGRRDVATELVSTPLRATRADAGARSIAAVDSRTGVASAARLSSSRALAILRTASAPDCPRYARGYSTIGGADDRSGTSTTATRAPRQRATRHRGLRLASNPCASQDIASTTVHF